MNTLEKEHLKLMEEHAQFKNLYLEQSSKITDINQRNEQLEDENQKLKSEIDKTKRNSNKIEKDCELKTNEIKEELQCAFKEISEFVQ